MPIEMPHLRLGALTCAPFPVEVRHYGAGADDDRLSAFGREVASSEIGLRQRRACSHQQLAQKHVHACAQRRQQVTGQGQLALSFALQVVHSMQCAVQPDMCHFMKLQRL